MSPDASLPRSQKLHDFDIDELCVTPYTVRCKRRVDKMAEVRSAFDVGLAGAVCGLPETVTCDSERKQGDV
jgi:hypothetical protein